MSKGRRPLPWIKLWFDILGDPKMTRLSIAERGCWHSILLLAGQSPIRGKLMLTETEAMTLDDIANALHLTPEERPVLESCVSKLVTLDSLRWNGRCLEVVHFKERQEVYPSDFEDYHKKSLLINSEITPAKLQKEVEGRGERKEVEVDSTPKPSGLGARKRQADPEVGDILSDMRTLSGYPEKTPHDPIPNYGKEGSAIKRMLARRFTREEILACWRSKVSQRGGEFVSMTWVNEDIADFVRGGEPVPDTTKAERGGDTPAKKQIAKGGERGQVKGQRVRKVRGPEDFRGGKW